MVHRGLLNTNKKWFILEYLFSYVHFLMTSRAGTGIMTNSLFNQNIEQDLLVRVGLYQS